MVSRLPLALIALIFMLALSDTSTTVPVSHAATATSFTFAVGGDHGDSLLTGPGAASLSRLAGTPGLDFYLAIGDLSYTNTTTGTTWCSQFKTSYNNVEVLAGNHDTGEENGTAATRSYERYVTGCPYTLTASPLNCGPVVLNCYGKEYYFDYPALNPVARFIMISPVVYNITGVCTPATTIRCNSSWPGTSCTDTYGCWPYFANDPHYTWVSSTIDNARASSTIKWVIVGMHKVCISAGDQNCNVGPDLLNLMLSKKVDLVLEGHDHSYQRSKQLALNGSSCTGITTTNSYPTYNSNCVVNDGSAGIYTPGAGTVVVIQGTFGAPFNNVNDPSPTTGCTPCAAEAPYFAKLMGLNTPGNGHGFMQYTVSADRIDAKSSFSGSFSDSFTIGRAFTMSSSPTSLVIQVGASSSSTITVTSQAGFTGTVSLSLSSLGCACTSPTLTPNSVDLTALNPTATAVLQVGGASPGGNVTFTVTGTSGTLSFSTQVAVSVQDFSISANPTSLTLNFNAAGTSTINLASLNNFAGNVTLTPTISPQGIPFSLDKSSILLASKGSGSATLTVTGSAPGNYTLTVTAINGPTSHAAIVKVRVLGDFTMSPSKTSLTLSPGSTDSTVIIQLLGSGRFAGTVNLATSITPSGPTASLAPSSLMLKGTQSSDGLNSTILTVNAGMVSGTYRINVTATSGLLFHSTIITLTVGKTNPTITTTLSASSISAGGSVSDSAALAGATTTAGGTVTYSAFSGTVCSGTPIFVQTVSVTNGVVPGSRVVQFNVTGSFEWQAIYSGDANNSPSPPSTCGSELLTVRVTTTTVTTTLSSASIVPGGTVFDSATLTGFFGGFSTGGTATYSVFAGTLCTGTPVFTQTVNVNSVNGAIPNSRSVQFNATGTYQWQVAYSGDANNGVSTSVCGSESLSVGKATPSITTKLSSNSIIVGNSVSDNATVSGGATPTGTVTFSVYSGSACSGTVVATKTVALTSGFAGPVNVIFNNTGTFNWQAVYNGDASNNIAASPCGTETLTVVKAAPTVTESLSATTIVVGNSANANGTISGGFSPSGTITFSVFAGSSCSGTLLVGKTMPLASGTAGPFSVIFNSTGTFNWQAAYVGDANNNPNTSPCKSLVVGKASPAITTTLSSTSPIVGSSVFDSASITNGYNAGGTVTYNLFTGSTCSGTSTPVGSPVTVTGGVVPNSISQPFNTAGAYSWNAVYGGDANNNLATSPCEPLTVNKTNPTIATVLSQNVIQVGSSVTASATLTSSFQAGGTVTYSFFSGSACSGSATIVGSPVAVSNGIVPTSSSQTFNTAGPYSWNAVYSGDANNNGATSTCASLTVNPRGGVGIATNLSALTITVGGSVFDSATITGATSTAGGTVTYNLFTGGACSGSPSPVSTVTVTNGIVPNSSSQTFSSVGAYSWNAIYSGDPNNSGATSTCEPLTVNKTSPTIATSVSPNPITVGQSITESAILTGSFQATGSVNYLQFSTGTCSGTNTIVSTVTVTNNVIPSSSPINPVPSGTYGFEASYSGDASNNPIISPCASLTVNKSSPTITATLSQSTIPVGSSVSDSATLSGGYQPGGTVTYAFFIGSSCAGTSTTVGSPVTVANGVVPGSASQSFNNAGSYSWNAVYSGDANNNAITSSCQPLTVSKASPAISTTLSANPVTVGGSVSAFATMTGGFQAGGSATYFLFSSADCTGLKNQVSVVNVNSGVIPSSSPQIFSSAGSFSWNVGYGGDANNNPVTSSCAPLTVNKANPSIAMVLSQNVIQVGSSVTASATLTSSFQAGGTVTYSFFSGSNCSGSATVVGNPATVTNGIVPNSAPQVFNSAGPYSWSAAYSGDTNNNGATSGCALLTVNPKGGVSIATNLSALTITVGGSAFDSATITGATGTAGGTVTYNLFTSGSCSGSSSVVSTVTVTNAVVPNSQSVTFSSTAPVSWNAVYSGDANNSGASSACEPLTVNKASPSIATSLSVNQIIVGQSMTESATLTGSFQAGGSVSYLQFSTGTCSGSPVIVSTVTVTNSVIPSSSAISPVPSGTYGFESSYSGDANNNLITSSCASLTVSKASPVISTTLSANPITVGGSVYDSAIMTGGFQAGGTVTYNWFSGGTCGGIPNTVSTVGVVNGGIPNSLARTFSSAGPYSWNAAYSGDANNNGIPSSCEPLTVNPTTGTAIIAALSSSSIPVGGSVTASATLSGVTSGAGGTVTYNSFSTTSCTGTPVVVSIVTVTNGAVPGSASKTFNSAGSFSWNAVYSGDANNGSASSTCLPLIVNQAAPSITTTVSGTNVPVGTPVHDSAILTNGFNAGGTVTYTLYSDTGCTVSGVIISTVTVTNGVVPDSSSKSPTPSGAYSFQASYTGDANNKPVTGVCEPFNVLKASPGITMSLSLNSIPVGSSVSASASMTGGFQPGGAVTYTFFFGSGCSGSPTTVGSPVTVTNGIVPVSASQTFNAAGTYAWSAVYSGDPNNSPITSPCQSLTVNKASPSVSTTLSPNSITVGGSVYASATMTGAFQAGGSATYFLFTTPDCIGSQTPVSTVTVNSGAMPGSSPQQFASAGTFSWNTHYFGDSNNNPVTSGCAPLTVNKASPTIFTTLSATTITVGQSTTDSAVISSGYNPSGTVTYSLFTTADCSGPSTLISTVTILGGTVPNSASHTFTSAGSYSWGALYSGDSNNNPSTTISCASLTVNRASGVVIAANLSQTAITVGGSVFDTATLAGATPTASGTVTYNLFSSGTCTGTSSVVETVAVTNGIVPNSKSVTFSNTSPVSWNAAYSGDANNAAPPPSSCEPLSISRITPTITASISSQSIIVGGFVTGSATLSGTFGSATGTVTYTLYSSTTCSGITTTASPVTVTNGVVPSSAPIPPNSAGSYSLIASYSGDGNNNPAPSNCVGLVVKQASPTVANSLPPSSTLTVGGSLSNSAIISGGYHPGGTLDYNLINGGCLGTPNLIATNTVLDGIVSASPSLLFNTVGTFGWNIVYKGDNNNNPASSSCSLLTIVKTSPKIASTLSNPAIAVGGSVYETATLIDVFQAGGTLAYKLYPDGSCTSGSSIVSTVTVTNGVAPNSRLVVFNYSSTFGWRASYSGDSNNNFIESACLPLTVNPWAPEVRPLPSTGTITVGDYLAFTALISKATTNAAGTLTYYLFTNGNCGGASTVISTVPVTSGIAQTSSKWQFPSAGPYSWNAIYSGDLNNSPATSPCGPLSISKAAPTISTTLSSNPISKGSAASSSATLSGGFRAGGTVTYNQFSSADCTGQANVVSTVTVNNNSVPTSSSQTFATDGKFSWNAVYSGDSNNTPATGQCKPLTVTAPPLLSVPSGLQSINSGSPVRFTVTATDPSWNNITLTASGLPQGASFPTTQSLTGSTSSTFSWTPSDSQGSADYKVTFTVDDGHGGKTNAQVTIHVTTINRSSPLNNAIPYFVVALVAGTALVLATPLLLRRFRK